MTMHDARQLPPQDLQSERALIGSVLFDDRSLDAVTGLVRPDDFYLDSHKKIFAAALKIAESGSGGVDGVTISVELGKQGVLDDIGGDAYLMSLVASVPHSGNAASYARIVAEMAKLRALVYEATQMHRDAHSKHAKASEILEACGDRILKLLESNTTGQAEVIRDVALRSMDRLTSPLEQGITLGYRDLDEMLYGAKPGQLILIAARPAVGKSALAEGIMLHVAKRHPVFMASLEMTSDEIFDRGVCSLLGVSLSELRPLARDGHSSQSVQEATNTLAQLPILIDDSSDQTVQSIAAQARIMQRKQGLGLIIVDYLQLITPSDKRAPREQQVGQIAWALKCLAKNLSVPVVALAQLNREIDKRPDKTPKLSDIRESGAVEQHSSVIVFLDRPAEWNPEQHDAEEAVLYVAKHRNGRKGKIDLKWDARCATFRDADGFSPQVSVPNVFDYAGTEGNFYQ